MFFVNYRPFFLRNYWPYTVKRSFHWQHFTLYFFFSALVALPWIYFIGFLRMSIGLNKLLIYVQNCVSRLAAFVIAEPAASLHGLHLKVSLGLPNRWFCVDVIFFCRPPHIKVIPSWIYLSIQLRLSIELDVLSIYTQNHVSRKVIFVVIKPATSLQSLHYKASRGLVAMVLYSMYFFWRSTLNWDIYLPLSNSVKFDTILYFCSLLSLLLSLIYGVAIFEFAQSCFCFHDYVFLAVRLAVRAAVRLTLTC